VASPLRRLNRLDFVCDFGGERIRIGGEAVLRWLGKRGENLSVAAARAASDYREPERVRQLATGRNHGSGARCLCFRVVVARSDRKERFGKVPGSHQRTSSCAVVDSAQL